ncbi:sugar transferase [Enterococcus faecalis]|uniref:sugar transferase n=1 Tax=Enterococcus faecalis TaxID=1351 RepID=UPI001E32E422|nr:sugar transferase [Enterococcus faecalis]MCD5032923.1 sugar transferase [Enterococcus faecalis]
MNKLNNYYSLYGKRILDTVLSLLGLLCLLPFFFLIVILIKLDSKGPVFFSQIRVGENGKLFKIYKFRTMCRHAEKMKVFLQEKNEMGRCQFKIKDDPRITVVGKYLRRSSVDELPQLWNVLKGDMSLVGPRPALQEEVLEYSDIEKERLKVKPGCSGLWQVSGRNHLTFDSMIELDMKYIENINLKNDLVIIFKTVKIMLTGYGAY